MNNSKQPLIENEFGTVYNDHLKFNSKRGWFDQGQSKELPIDVVKFVSLENTRSVLWGVVFLVIGAGFCFSRQFAFAAGLLLMAWALLILWGSPRVQVATMDGDLRPARGFPWNRGAAQAFVAAVRRALSVAA